MKDKLEKLHKEIQELAKSTYEVFRYDSAEVQREWISFTEKIDKVVEGALRQTVKRSLQELSKAINGDGKSEVYPLFHVNVVLEMSKVELKPTVEELVQLVNHTSRELISTISIIPRLTEVLANHQTPTSNNSAEKLASFYEMIRNDEEILKIFSVISTGMMSHSEQFAKCIFFSL
jgi:dynein heavy chain